MAIALATRLVLLCLGLGGAPAPADPELDAIVGMLVGRFDTTAQAEHDLARDTLYKHDRAGLAIAEVPAAVAGALPPGRWLYVENTLLQAPERPYRQRLYRLLRKHGLATVEVWKIAEAGRFAGGAERPERLAELAASELSYEPGCDVPLRGEGGGFRGRTAERTCRTSVRGASYVTSEVTVAAEGQVTLDRGFDDAGQQKWGPTDGRGYEFRRRSP